MAHPHGFLPLPCPLKTKMFQYIGYNFIEGLASVWGTLMPSALFLYKCKREGADRPGLAQKTAVRG